MILGIQIGVIIGNLLSFAGGLIDFIFGLKFNEKLKNIQGNLISSTLSLIAYIFLNAYDGVINCAVTLLRLATIYIKDKHHKKFHFIFVLFFSLYCLVFFDYSGVQTIFLFLSSMCSFIPKWISKDMQKIRLGALMANVLAIVYNMIVGNFMVIVIQIINILLLIITIAKWAKKWRKGQDSNLRGY